MGRGGRKEEGRDPLMLTSELTVNTDILTSVHART